MNSSVLNLVNQEREEEERRVLAQQEQEQNPTATATTTTTTTEPDEKADEKQKEEEEEEEETKVASTAATATTTSTGEDEEESKIASPNNDSSSSSSNHAEEHTSIFEDMPRMPRRKATNIAGKRVLLVEDVKSIRLVASRLLQKSGAEVIAVPNGRKGVEAVAASIAERKPFEYVQFLSTDSALSLALHQLHVVARVVARVYKTTNTLRRVDTTLYDLPMQYGPDGLPHACDGRHRSHPIDQEHPR